MKTRKTLLRHAASACAVLLLSLASPRLHAVATIWDGSDGNWTTSTSWSAGNPGYTTNHAVIQEGNVTVNSAPLTAQYLLLVQGANGAGKTATLTINAGANLGMGTAADSQIGTAAGGTGTVIHNAGTVNFDRSLVLGGTGSNNTGGTGIYTLNSGSFGVKNDFIMGNNTASSSFSYLNLNGGTANLQGNLKVGAARYTGGSGGRLNTAIVTIAGGTLNLTGDYTHGLATTNGAGAIEATTRITGSKATINIGGNLTLNQNARNDSTLAFTLDDGGVSTINVTGNATLAGTLNAGLKGGLTLTRTNEFTLVNAGGTLTSDFATGPDSSLWTTTTASDALKLTLASSARKATLAAVDNTTVGTGAFAAATTGFVEITGLAAGQELTLYLNADAGTGKTIDDLAAWFTDNGVAATALAGMDGYNLSISKTAADSTAWLAWDLSAFNADATLSAIGLATAAVPEPAAWTAITALALLACVVARRLKGAATSA
ncbi:hypothetical protein OPIT5_00555 [Opitutaceae bacterium TAV5]|nr:hypothetical protein OPIT5_00555 [Opitutaceae bacterium TAV5]